MVCSRRIVSSLKATEIEGNLSNLHQNATCFTPSAILQVQATKRRSQGVDFRLPETTNVVNILVWWPQHGKLHVHTNSLKHVSVAEQPCGGNENSGLPSAQSFCVRAVIAQVTWDWRYVPHGKPTKNLRARNGGHKFKRINQW